MISSRADVLENFGEEYFVIPKTCKAVVVFDEGPNFSTKIVDVQIPEPDPNEVLVRLNATGVCKSDLSFLANDYGYPKMSLFGHGVAGHEGAGVVVKLGSNVKNWEIGDRIGIKAIRDTCGLCDECWRGRDNLCQRANGHASTHPGTFQQYITTSARYATRIPDGVSDELAGPLMCAGITAYRALLESNYKHGYWVVFPGGGGGVGNMAVQFAKAMGFRPIVVDTGADKEKLSLATGAEVFIDFQKADDPIAEVKRVADGIGAHGVVVTAAQAYQNAVDYIGSRGGARIMCVGMPSSEMIVGAEIHRIVTRNISLVGSVVGSHADADDVLDYARRGLINFVGEVRPLQKLPETLQQLRQGKVAGRVTIDFNAV